MVVGGNDTRLLERNREATERFAGETALHVVEGAGHLFGGEGELEEVADAADRFVDELA